MSQYQVKAGPEAFLPPAAASMGVVLPDPGEAHIEGTIVPEEEAYEHCAKKILEAKEVWCVKMAIREAVDQVFLGTASAP